MEMYALIKFDRPIEKGVHVISPGGYEMSFSNGKTVQFDFMDFDGDIDKEDTTVLRCHMETLDTDAFPDSEFLKTFTGSVTEIKEFFVYTGEPNDSEINPVELKSLFLYNDNNDNISIKRSLFADVFERRNV
jgi:hypothetical protein